MPAPLTWEQVKNWWKREGGDPGRADMAAAVAMAESGGRYWVTHTNASGSVDNGLYQINRQRRDPVLLEPGFNTRVAIQMSNNGRNWRPWCTAYSDGACGSRGGCFMCAGSPVLKRLRDHGGNMVGGSAGAAVAPDPGQPPSGTPPFDWSRWVAISRDQMAFTIDAAANYARGIQQLRR